MSVLEGCQGKYAVPIPGERRCPVCGERVEVFSRAGKLSVDSVCPLCGYRFPAEPQPGFISEKQL